MKLFPSEYDSPAEVLHKSARVLDFVSTAFMRTDPIELTEDSQCGLIAILWEIRDSLHDIAGEMDHAVMTAVRADRDDPSGEACVGADTEFRRGYAAGYRDASGVRPRSPDAGDERTYPILDRDEPEADARKRA